MNPKSKSKKYEEIRIHPDTCKGWGYDDCGCKEEDIKIEKREVEPQSKNQTWEKPMFRKMATQSKPTEESEENGENGQKFAWKVKTICDYFDWELESEQAKVVMEALHKAYEAGRKSAIEEMKEKLEWITSDDTGVSSKVIWSVMMSVKPQDKCTPCDPSDFGRCYRLLKKFPDWEARVKELGSLVSYSPIVNGEQRPNLWQVFSDNYEELKRLYEEECVGQDWVAKKLYKRMEELGF